MFIRNKIDRKKKMNILLKKNLKESKKNESKSSISINQMGILNSYNMSLLSSK
jgi:hypothetical protein